MLEGWDKGARKPGIMEYWKTLFQVTGCGLHVASLNINEYNE
jgi:hypothetical protein